MKNPHTRPSTTTSALRAVGVSSIAWSCCSALAETIGSPLFHRQFADIDFGQVYIYKRSPFRRATT